MKQRIFYIVLLVLLSGGIHTLKAQQVNVRAVIDSTRILIGDQLNLKLEIEKPKDLDIQFPQIPDTFSSHIEVVKRSKIDTIKLERNSYFISDGHCSDKGYRLMAQNLFTVIDRYHLLNKSTSKRIKE